LTLELPRRNFLQGLGLAILAAPAIVKSTNIMPVRNPPIFISKPVFQSVNKAWMVTDVEYSGCGHGGAQTKVRLCEIYGGADDRFLTVSFDTKKAKSVNIEQRYCHETMMGVDGAVFVPIHTPATLEMILDGIVPFNHDKLLSITI
jgi:hypothetical protein